MFQTTNQVYYNTCCLVSKCNFHVHPMCPLPMKRPKVLFLGAYMAAAEKKGHSGQGQWSGPVAPLLSDRF